MTHVFDRAVRLGRPGVSTSAILRACPAIIGRGVQHAAHRIVVRCRHLGGVFVHYDHGHAAFRGETIKQRTLLVLGVCHHFDTDCP